MIAHEQIYTNEAVSAIWTQVSHAGIGQVAGYHECLHILHSSTTAEAASLGTWKTTPVRFASVCMLMPTRLRSSRPAATAMPMSRADSTLCATFAVPASKTACCAAHDI